MIRVQETTKWDAQNHIYLLSECKMKCYGYVRDGVETLFKKPMKFDARYRTFKKI